MKKVSTLFIAFLIVISIFYIIYIVVNKNLNQNEHPPSPIPEKESYMTPFIEDYFERYELNKNSQMVGLLSTAIHDVCHGKLPAQIPCGIDDEKKLKQLA